MSIHVYYKDWLPSNHTRSPTFKRPIYRANHDVLFNIFGFLQSGDPFSATKDIINSSKVCQAWRQTALDAPGLWTHISFSFFRRHQEHPQAKAFLHRSRNLPIDLRIHAVRPPSWEEMTLPRTHAHRFRSIELLASNIYLMPFLFKGFNLMADDGLLNHLQRFKFDVVRGSGFMIQRDSQLFDPTDGMSYLPPLVKEVLFNWSRWNTTGLTSLTLHHPVVYGRISVDVFREMLTMCRNTLLSFRWMGTCPAWDVTELPPITLPALRRLYIGYVNNFEPMFYLLNTPALASCTFHNIASFYDVNKHQAGVLWDEEQVTMPDMISVWEKLTSCQLNDLSIIGEKSLHGPAFFQFLSSQTKLQSLVLYEVGRPYHKAFFEQSADIEAFLPKLKYLLFTSEVRLADFSAWLERRISGNMDPLYSITTTPQTLYRIHEVGLFETMGSATRLVKEIPEPEVKSEKKFTIGPYKTIMSRGKWIVPPMKRL